METWKAITGIIVFLIGAVMALQGYNAANQCSSAVGVISTFLSSLLGGSAAQNCYNAQVSEWGGLVIAIIGLVVIYTAQDVKKGRK